MAAIEATFPAGTSFVYASAPNAKHVWYDAPPNGKSVGTNSRDWDAASVQHLVSIVSTQGPFDGLLGYSQGAAMALSLLSEVAPGTFDNVYLFSPYLPTTHLGVTSRIRNHAPYNVSAFVYTSATDPIVTTCMTKQVLPLLPQAVVSMCDGNMHALPRAGSDGLHDLASHHNLTLTSDALPQCDDKQCAAQQGKRIAAVGDSLTYGFQGPSWVDLLSLQVPAGTWVANFGINSATASSFMSSSKWTRLQQEIWDTVLFMFGTNEWLNNATSTFQHDFRTLIGGV